MSLSNDGHRGCLYHGKAARCGWDGEAALEIIQTRSSVLAWVLEIKDLVCGVKAELGTASWQLWRKMWSQPSLNTRKKTFIHCQGKKLLSAFSQKVKIEWERKRMAIAGSWVVTLQRDSPWWRVRGHVVKPGSVLTLKKEYQCWTAQSTGLFFKISL